MMNIFNPFQNHCTTQPHPQPSGPVPVLVCGDRGSWPPPETFPTPSAFWGQGTRCRRFSGGSPCRPSPPSTWRSSSTQRTDTETTRTMLVFMVPLGASSPRDRHNESFCSGNGDKYVPGGDIWNTDQHELFFVFFIAWRDLK